MIAAIRSFGRIKLNYLFDFQYSTIHTRGCYLLRKQSLEDTYSFRRRDNEDRLHHLSKNTSGERNERRAKTKEKVENKRGNTLFKILRRRYAPALDTIDLYIVELSTN